MSSWAPLPPHPSDSTSSTTVAESVDYNTFTPTTSEHDDSADFLEDPSSATTCIPSDGTTVIIRCVSSGEVITLLDGQVVLAPLQGRGGAHQEWSCMANGGWLGFRNRASHKFLRHESGGVLDCEAEQDGKRKDFTVTPVPPHGGYVLQMTHWFALGPVVMRTDNGLRKLARTDGKLADGIIWEFEQVE